MLKKGNLTYRKLVQQATHLAQVALKTAPLLLQEQQVLQVFLRALPAARHQKVPRVDHTTLKDATAEVERQEELMTTEVFQVEAGARVLDEPQETPEECGRSQ